MSFSIDLAARKLKTKFTAHMVSGKRKLLFFVWGFGPYCSTVIKLLLPTALFPHFFFAIVFCASKFILLRSVVLSFLLLLPFLQICPHSGHLTGHIINVFADAILLAVVEALAGRYPVNCYKEKNHDFGDFIEE